MADDKLVTTKRDRLIVQDDGPLGYLMDTARYQQMQHIALSMSRASLMPKHLEGQNPTETAANCFLVVNQAIRWGFDPFAVAPETYSPPGSGKLGYQGKLIAGVVNARAGLQRRLRYEFSGKGLDRQIIVRGEFVDDPDGETRTITLTVRQALEGANFCKKCGGETPNTVMENAWIMACTVCKTPNVSFKGKTIRPHHMFRGDAPDQKLMYTGVTMWARRHCPEIVLGVLTRDELEISQQSHPVAPQDVELWKRAEPTEVPTELPAGNGKPPVEVTATLTEDTEPEPEPKPPKRKRRTKAEMEAARAAEAEAAAQLPRGIPGQPVLEDAPSGPPEAVFATVAAEDGPDGQPPEAVFATVTAVDGDGTEDDGPDLDDPIADEVGQERENWIQLFQAETTRAGLARKAATFRDSYPEGTALYGDAQLKDAYRLALKAIKAQPSTS